MSINPNDACVVCNVCESGSLNQSSEVGSVRCNVREFSDLEFTVWRCHECSSLHCKEAIDFEKFYRNYPLDRQHLNYMTKVAYRNRLRMLKRSGIDTSQKILDYGCGEGLFTNFLKDAGYSNLEGYDPFSKGYSSLPAESQFDLAYSFGVIEHVPCPRDFLKVQKSLVKENGVVVVATPQADGLAVNDSNALLMHQPYHRHILSLQGLEMLAGLEGMKLTGLENRNWMDTLHPALNSRFVEAYIRHCGGEVDCLFESRKVSKFLTTPSLWMPFWFGGIRKTDNYMVATFQSIQ